MGSPAGPCAVLWSKCSKRTLHFLRSTLNAAFAPDYDFIDAKSTEFAREASFSCVNQQIDSHFRVVFGDAYTAIAEQLWGEVDHVIAVDDSEVFSYSGTITDDAESSLWSFTYFIYNKRRKRILLFAFRAASGECAMDSSEDEFLPFPHDATLVAD